ncbi:gamma-butyrobetaine dioxygenase-like isoform X3 [Apostichopus japonicus]|uniref:gamma-butyrobetaine dioxygenase-like isoform X3 n=1 Tax=Stichopus japonicus TaxID=307972 RepID=UPI003AB2C360
MRVTLGDFTDFDLVWCNIYSTLIILVLKLPGSMLKAIGNCVILHAWRGSLATSTPLVSKYSHVSTFLRVPTRSSAVQLYTNGVSKKEGKNVSHSRQISESSNKLQQVDDSKARYMQEVFLRKTDTGGGHVIFASEDSLNPILSEIRFAADAVYHNFPYVWFRDHCRCSSCVDGNMRSKVAIQDLDPDIEPVLDQTTPMGSSISILWKDGHYSKYPERWLWAHRFGQMSTGDFLSPSHCIRWDANEISKSLKRYNFHELLEDDKSLLDWLLEIHARGLTIIQGAPEEPHQVEKLGERIGFLRRCHFGSTLQEKIHFETHKEGGLSLETDLPYLSLPPSVHLLHCVNQHGLTNNDEAKIFLADGFHASDALRDEEPHSSEILSKMEWEYFDVQNSQDGEYHLRSTHPAIRFNSQGHVSQIVFNDRLRGSGLNVPANFVSPAYESLKKFVSTLNQPKNVFEYSLKPGEIVARDNRRVLHRWAPITSPGFESQVEGAYLDWDELSSKIRVLFKKLL